MKKETIEVEIIREGSERAEPSIWYAGMDGCIFKVVQSEWPAMWGVSEGKFKGKIISKNDCINTKHP